MAQQEAFMKPFYISKDFTYIRILIKYYIRLIKTNQLNKDSMASQNSYYILN